MEQPFRCVFVIELLTLSISTLGQMILFKCLDELRMPNEADNFLLLIKEEDIFKFWQVAEILEIKNWVHKTFQSGCFIDLDTGKGA